jgi:hypothetical protein
MSELSARPHALTLWSQYTDPEEMRRKLGELSDERVALDNAIGHAVARARKLGLSWETIGAELLTSKQAAWQRWRWVEGQ